MSTKEAYQKAMDSLEDCNYHSEFMAIDAYVTSLESQLAAKDAEIAELKASLKTHINWLDASIVREDKRKEENNQLQQQLTTAKADQRFYREEFARVDSELTALRSRIKSAPVITVWRNNETGEIHRIHTNGAEGETLVAAEGVWLPMEVHAVPVEEKE